MRAPLAFTGVHAWDGHGLVRGCSAVVTPAVRGYWFQFEQTHRCTTLCLNVRRPWRRLRRHQRGAHRQWPVFIPRDRPRAGSSSEFLCLVPIHRAKASQPFGDRLPTRGPSPGPARALLAVAQTAADSSLRVHPPPALSSSLPTSYPTSPRQSVQVLASDAVVRARLQLTPKLLRSRPEAGTPTPICHGLR